MGNSFNKSSESKNSKNSTLLPSFYYLNQVKNSIFKVHLNSVTKHCLSKFILYSDCAIGYLPDNNIVVAGGEKPTGRLSKKVFFINTSTRAINRLSSLKFPSKFGTLLYTDSKLYYFSASLTLKHQVYLNNSWEILITSTLNLSYPVVCADSGEFFFLCGIKPNNKPTKKIYTLNLMKNNEYSLIEKFTPFRLNRPIIISKNGTIAIGGGKKLSGEENYNFFFHNLSDDKWKEVEGPRYKIENYPGFFFENTMIWMAFPKIIVIMENKFDVYNLLENKNILEKIKSIKDKRKSKVTPLKDMLFSQSDTKELLSGRKAGDAQAILLDSSCLPEKKIY